MDRSDSFLFSWDDIGEPAALRADASDTPGETRSTIRRLRSVVRELLDALTSTVYDERVTAKEFLSRAAVLLETTAGPRAPDRPAKGGLAPWQFRALAAHVETNLDKRIRSAELAGVVRLNPAYFCRVFRESFGEPPLQYIGRRRVERAQRLMLSTDNALSQIAFECGFSDQAHFSRLFRRVTGDTPRAWRRARAGSHAGAACARPQDVRDRSSF